MEKEAVENPLVTKRKKDALIVSIKEGSAASVSTSFGDSFITPLALELTPPAIRGIIIGMLSAFSSLLSQIAQLFGSRLMEKHSRKKIVLTFVFLQSLMWIPIASLSILLWKDILTGYLPFILIIFYTILAIFGGLAHPSWFSWMGDLVPEDQRGKYFSKRNLVIGIIGLSVALIGAFLLETFRRQNLLIVGFSIIFFCSFIFRMISFSYFRKQYSPKFKVVKKDYFSFWSFIKRYDNFGKFAVYQSFFNFAIMFASPFFAVYMLEELKFNYVTYIIVTISSTAFYLMFLPLIGKFSDKYGNLRLLYLANICFFLSPVLWMLVNKPLLLIFIPQIIVGLGNAALVISVTNFTYSSVSPQKRGVCIAYTNILIGIGTFAGAILGGIVLNYVPINFMNKFFFIFSIAAILRLSVALLFLPKIQEVKLVERIPHLHISLSHPFRWLNSEINHVNKSEKVQLRKI